MSHVDDRGRKEGTPKQQWRRARVAGEVARLLAV
jgi:hypothetical protein